MVKDDKPRSVILIPQRIIETPEDIRKILVGYTGRVKFHLDSFNMTGNP
jgi:hypothetical protein